MKNNIRLLVSGLVASTAVAGAVWQYGPCSFPPIPSSPTPVPNARDYFSKAATGLRQDEEKVHLPAKIIPEVYTTYPPSLQYATLRVVAPHLRMMRKGLAYSYAYPQDRAHPNMVVYPSYRELARLLRLQGSVAARQGDWNGAINSYIDCIKLGILVPHGSPVVGEELGSSCEYIGRMDIWPVITHLSYDQAQKVKLQLVNLESQREPYLVAQTESKYSGQAMLQGYFKSADWADELAYAQAKYMDDSKRPSDYEIHALAFRLNVEGKRAVYNQFTNYQDAVIEAVSKPYKANARVKDVPLDAVTAFYYPRFGIDPYSANQYYRAWFMDSQTQNQMLIVALALRQYWLTNHAYPKSLADLTPKYLSTVPSDPFAPSRPLQYSQLGPSYRIYSVGPDGKDNCGFPIPKVTGEDWYVKDTSLGDIVAGITP
jgi:hypothetical protein